MNGGYEPGDKYSSVRDLASSFSVSTVTAHRVIKELVQRSLVEVLPRVGTFIGKGVLRNKSRVSIVHFIIQPKYNERRRFMYEGLQEGILSSVEKSAIQLNILPEHNSEDFLTHLKTSGPEIVGSVLMHVSPWVHRFFAQRRLPAVVIGHVEEDTNLPNVDRDQYRMGQTSLRHLSAKGHSTIGLLMPELWKPGDNLLVTGIEDVISDPHTPGIRLKIQSLATESSSSRKLVQRLLQREDRPTALICRTHSMALEALEIAKKLALLVPKDLAILCLGRDEAALKNAKPPITSMSYSGWDLGCQVGSLLSLFKDNRWPGKKNVEMPSRLIERQST